MWLSWVEWWCVVESVRECVGRYVVRSPADLEELEGDEGFSTPTVPFSHPVISFCSNRDDSTVVIVVWMTIMCVEMTILWLLKCG